MKIWPWVPDVLRNWFSKQEKSPNNNSEAVAKSSTKSAEESLRELLEDPSVPVEVRKALDSEYNELAKLVHKLEQNEIHIAVFGRVSVGKSSLLNALMGEEFFAVSPLHGQTTEREQQEWKNYQSQNSSVVEHQTGGVHFIDTPGIDEVRGENQEIIARKAALRADIILFVVDSDLTQLEFQALQSLNQYSQPMLLILNKADHYSEEDLTRLLGHIHTRVKNIIDEKNILATCSKALTKKTVHEQIDGSYREQTSTVFPDISLLKERIWQIIESDGRTLAALNASLFASDLSDDVGRQVLALRRELAKDLITNYSLAKGIAVAANPVPVVDLLAAAGLDASMIIHLSRLHGLPMTSDEAGDLVKVIISQLAALMGTTWAIHALSTVLKISTAGLSTFLTATVQGSIAYYATVVLGRVAETWLAQGKSWGKQGPKVVVKNIMNNLDRSSILQEGREAILEKLGRK